VEVRRDGGEARRGAAPALSRGGERRAGLPDAYETAAAKLACNLAGWEVANEALQAMGGMGFSEESIVEYCVRRTRGWMIAGGSIEISRTGSRRSVFERKFDQRNALPENGTEALLHPRSVAIVGASDDPTKTTGRPLRFLRQSGFAGAVYPVNPKRETVLGERAWPSIAALPEVPEHAYIVTGTELALEAVRECGERGVKVATILAAGSARRARRARAAMRACVTSWRAPASASSAPRASVS
jgi:predicted CoA-binding protein